MTDEQIIKALECCGMNRECPIDCPYAGDGLCIDNSRRDALDLVKRQQEKIEALIAGQETLQRYIKAAKTEAIKEFADKLQAKAHTAPVSWYEMYMTVEKIVTVEDIDNLAKEMGCVE